MELLADYTLFLAKLLTVAAIGLGLLLGVVVISRRGGAADGLQIEHLNKRMDRTADAVRAAIEGRAAQRRAAKARQKAQKAQKKQAKSAAAATRKRIYVIDFKGDLRASATASLREEVSAVLALARPEDQVLLRLENAGGMVHEHGLAASQLLRLKQRGIRLIVAVDKVAASGGYLMACVADRIMAAPFAIVGSIGVLAQLPNFHRLLERQGIDFEQITAGRFKRTLTMFGENTDEGRAKLKDELEEIHALFKQQIVEHRPAVDLERIATGEHWHGLRALALNLVDEICTSDDFLLAAASDHDLYRVVYHRRRSWQERMFGGAVSLLGG